MHPTVYREFERVCAPRGARARVLEIGAIAGIRSLLAMESLRDAAVKVGINLEGPARYRDFLIMQGNGNYLPWFPDEVFDIVLCNAVIEHDPYFWRTVREMKRLTRPGGLMMVGAPGYVEYPFERKVTRFFSRFKSLRQRVHLLTKSTVTISIHNRPGDYYRFSPEAFRAVILEGLADVEVFSVMVPPRIIGYGIKPA